MSKPRMVLMLAGVLVSVTALGDAQPPKPIIEDVYVHPDYTYNVSVGFRMRVSEGESLIKCKKLWRREIAPPYLRDVEYEAKVVDHYCLEEPTTSWQGGMRGYAQDERYNREEVFPHGIKYEFELWAIDAQGRVTTSDPYIFEMTWGWGVKNELTDWLHDLERRLEVIEGELGIEFE